MEVSAHRPKTSLAADGDDLSGAKSMPLDNQRIEQALTAFREDGSASISDLARSIDPPLTEAGAVYHGRMWSEVQQLLRYFSIQGTRGKLQPVEGQKFVAALHRSLTQLDAELRKSGTEPPDLIPDFLSST